jgi:hypothetical protein
MRADDLDRHITGNWGEDSVVEEPATIRYGFLTGNLFAAWSQEEIDALNVSASVSTFARMLEQEIGQAFPSAEVTVEFRDRIGSIPADIQTAAWDSRGNDLPDVLLTVEEIGSRLFELGLWHKQRNQS